MIHLNFSDRSTAMAGYSELHKYLLRLVILPVSVLCAVVSITYFYLYSHEKNQTGSAHEVFLKTLLKPSFNLIENNPQALAQLAKSVLSMDAHRALVVKDELGNILASYGSPDENILHENFSKSFSGENHFYYVLDFTSDQHKKGRIIVQTENFYSRLNLQKAMTGVVLAITLCFLVLLYFARQFDVALTSPLILIQTGIRTFLNGDYNSPIKIHSGSIYEELVSLINNLAASHKSGQEHYQENIEQTIQDLKETLESVEIQNIEIDLERKNAVQANRAKSEFLTNTSHELKTPLNSIIGFTELLDKTELNEQQTDYLRSINDAAKGLSATINDILDFSRLEMGTLTLEHKPVNVRELLDEVIQQLTNSATKQHICLLSVVDHDVPDNLLGDPLRVKQILSNLISNAIKFTPEGYVLINISNELISDERYTLRFKVTDSGIGISSGQQDTLFASSASQLTSSDNRRISGTGLGLIIAKGLVERMNGHIEVESSEGKGSTFWFTATFAKNLALKNQQEQRVNSLQDINAVVVEPNTMSRMEICHYLRGWGVDTEETPKLINAEGVCRQKFKNSGKNILIIDVDLQKKDFNREIFIEEVSNLAKEYEAYCMLIYRDNENTIFQGLNKPTFISEISKPVLYQNLYQLLCNRFGISSQQYYSSEQEDTAEYSTPKVKVLAVDDNPANLKLVKELLKDKGAETDTADSGSQAIEYFQRTPYDIILMDVQMPDMDGMATTVKIRELEDEGQRIPIVALTAHAASEKKMALLIAGMDDYISKPINSDDLQHIFDRWINKKGLTTTKAQNTEFAEEKPEITAPVSVKLSLQKTQNKPDLAKEMLEMLLASLNDTKDAVQKHFNDENIEGVQEAVHKLYGGCCYCGVPELTSICARIDDNLQKNHTQGLQEDLDILFTKIDELSDWSKDIEIDELFCTE